MPASQYEANCDNDENSYESAPLGNSTKKFPYVLKNFIGKDYGKIASTPYGNNIVEELAKQAISNEALGADDVTDLLALSFSSPDYIGHSFGPDSWETMDNYIKLDEILADFFTFFVLLFFTLLFLDLLFIFHSRHRLFYFLHELTLLDV